MSEVIGARCGINYKLGGKHQVCASFYQDVRKGAIRIDQERGGWIDFTMKAKRGMSRSPWIYLHLKLKRGIPDMTGDDFLLTEICPRCGGELPSVTVKNAVPHAEPEE